MVMTPTTTHNTLLVVYYVADYIRQLTTFKNPKKCVWVHWLFKGSLHTAVFPFALLMQITVVAHRNPLSWLCTSSLTGSWGCVTSSQPSSPAVTPLQADLEVQPSYTDLHEQSKLLVPLQLVTLVNPVSTSLFTSFTLFQFNGKIYRIVQKIDSP